VNDIAFYGDWLFYGGIAAVIGAMLTLFIYAKITNATTLSWKPCTIIIVIFAFPSMILPLLLAPIAPLSEKLGFIAFIVLFGVA
jgi:hypothetical protein